jgi:predicted nuclease with TOPRIM domain
MTEGDPIDLTLTRLARLEAAQHEANAKLERMDGRFQRLEETLERRLEQLEQRNQPDAT